MIKERIAGTTLAALLLAAAPAAQAVATLSFQLDGGATTLCADGDACDVNAGVGVVTFVTAAGPVTVNVTTGLSQPTLTGDPLIDLNFVVNITGDHELIIGFSDTDFSAGGTFTSTFGGTLNGTGSTISAEGFYDAGNALFADTTSMGSIGPFGPGAFSGSLADGNAPAGSYSVTQYITIDTGANGGTASGDFAISVPEPTTLALIGLGLFAFGMRRRV